MASIGLILHPPPATSLIIPFGFLPTENHPIPLTLHPSMVYALSLAMPTYTIYSDGLNQTSVCIFRGF